MKNMKKTTNILAITLVIAGLVITSAAGLSLENKSEIKNEEFGIAIQQSQPLACVKAESNAIMDDESFLVFDGEYDAYHPSISPAPAGGYFAMMETSEDDSIWQPSMFQSADGETWDPVLTALYDNAQYTDMDSNSQGTFGTFGASPDLSGNIIIMQGEIADGWVWAFGDNGYADLYYNRIASYDDPEYSSVWGTSVLTGTDPSFNTGVPYIFYQEVGPNTYGLIGWMNNRYGYVHADVDVDPVALYGYNVYDHEDGDHLFVRVVNEGVWQYNSGQDYYYHDNVKTLDIDETEFTLMYPAVGAYDDTVIVLAQTSNDEIICYFSDNALSTYQSIIIDEGLYPEIQIIDENTAYCTYIKDDNLLYAMTEDGGESWGTGEALIDSVVDPDWRAVDLNDETIVPLAIWQDARGDNNDIYFGAFADVQPPAKLEVTIQTGLGIGVKVMVKNIGGTDAVGVEGVITVTGGIFNRINTTAPTDIGALAIDEEVEIKSGLILGLGSIDITAEATAPDALPGSDAATGKNLFFLTKV